MKPSYAMSDVEREAIVDNYLDALRVKLLKAGNISIDTTIDGPEYILDGKHRVDVLSEVITIGIYYKKAQNKR